MEDIYIFPLWRQTWYRIAFCPIDLSTELSQTQEHGPDGEQESQNPQRPIKPTICFLNSLGKNHDVYIIKWLVEKVKRKNYNLMLCVKKPPGFHSVDFH